uniref:Importin N-terminal domain-containing protein n=1 Tax=Panagrolaimus sp. JU765 TaxID=591449 RepID=A0AC34Q3I6_9BILA
MTVADNDFNEVVQAVRAILDSATLNQERRRCTEKIESLKEGDASVSIPIAFRLLLQHDQQVSHAGWNIIEHIIRYKWAEIPGNLRLTIRDGVLEQMSNGRYSLTSADLAVKTAISRSMVAMMEQEWPQNWPELFQQFKDIVLNDQLYSQAQMVFIVLKCLIENVVTYTTVSNPLRRKELSMSINSIMPELFAMTISRIRICIAQGVDNEPILVAKAGIELLVESVDWVVGRLLEEVVDGIIEVLCAYLRTESHGIYEKSALCLFKIASRKRSKNDETPIVVSMFKDAPMTAILTAARLAAGVSSSNKGHYQYLIALCDLLCALGIHLTEVWGYIKNPPPNFESYLSEISFYFQHPSMRIRSEVALVLVTFASHEQISQTKEFTEAVKLLIPVIPKNTEKIGSLTDMTSLTSHYARMDYEDDVEFSRDFTQLRDRVCRFIGECSKSHCAEFVMQINEWIARIVGNTVNIPATEFESIKRYLTAFVTSIYQKFDNELPSDVDAAFVYNFQVLLARIQSVSSPDTVNLMLSVLSSFLKLFEKHAELLSPFFEHLKNILLIDLPTAEVMTLKRHAISLMLKVSSKMPEVIKPYAQSILDIVTATAPHVTLMQRANLVQVLGALSNLVPAENKIVFLQSAISQNVEFFASERFLQAISSPANFMSFIGLCTPPELDDTTPTQFCINRQDLKANLSAIDGILQQVNVPENSSNPLFQLLGALLPNFFQCAQCLNLMRHPDNLVTIHSGYDKAVVDIGPNDRHHIYCFVMEAETEESSDGSLTNTATSRLQTFIADITDMIQSILGQCGSRLGYDFYRLPNAVNFLDGLGSNLNYIIDFRMRFWIKRTFNPLINTCPQGLEHTIMSFASRIMQHMQERLRNRWESISTVDYDAEPTKEEIFLEHMTCVLSREYSGFLYDIFLGESNAPRDEKRNPSDVITRIGGKLCTDRNILSSVVATICCLLNCNDTKTALKILPIARVVFGTTTDYFDDQMTTYVFVHVIQSLQVHGADEVAQGPILSLIFQIYSSLRPKHLATLGGILQQVPETTREGLEAFDNRITNMSQTDKIMEKHRREVVKKILRPVIAKNIGEQHKRPSHLRVLQPLIKPPKSNGDSSSDISLDGGLFA